MLLQNRGGVFCEPDRELYPGTHPVPAAAFHPAGASGTVFAGHVRRGGPDGGGPVWPARRRVRRVHRQSGDAHRHLAGHRAVHGGNCFSGPEAGRGQI